MEEETEETPEADQFLTSRVNTSRTTGSTDRGVSRWYSEIGGSTSATKVFDVLKQTEW